jgi:hypothetical protein
MRGRKKRGTNYATPRQMATSEQVLSETVALVRECLADGKLDASEILRVGVFVAQKANAFRDMSGPKKKEFVLEAVKKALETAVPAERREQVGYTTALQVLPTVLDIAVAAAHGKLALKRVSAGCLAGCFGGLWGLRAQPAAAAQLVVREVASVVMEPEPKPELKAIPPSDANPEAVPPPKDESPLKESPKEPTPQASVEEAPLEIRPPEAASEESPSIAIEASRLTPVAEEL